MHASLEQAAINGLIAKNVAYKIKLPPKSKKPITVLTSEEQEKFTEIAKTTYTGEVFLLDLCTGLRIGELLGLQWGDIDFEGESLSVNRTLNVIKPDKKWTKAFGTPKTESSYRNIPLLPDAIKMLKGVKEKQADAKLKLGADYEDNDLVFCTQLGKPLDPRNMQKVFRRICDKARIEGLHIHCLRHTFATRGLENGIELRVMQDLLGHASIKETADTYTHVLPNKKRESMEKLIHVVKL